YFFKNELYCFELWASIPVYEPLIQAMCRCCDLWTVISGYVPLFWSMSCRSVLCAFSPFYEPSSRSMDRHSKSMGPPYSYIHHHLYFQLLTFLQLFIHRLFHFFKVQIKTGPINNIYKCKNQNS